MYCGNISSNIPQWKCMVLFCGFTVCSCTIGLIYLTDAITYSDVFGLLGSRGAEPYKDDSTGNFSSQQKLVLIWTPFFGDWNWGNSGLGKTPFQNGLCHYNNCIATSDKEMVDSADLVLFHCRDAFATWPTRRYYHQIYSVGCLESPMHSNFELFNNKVNMSVTYRLDSDIHAPYGAVVPKSAPSEGPYIPKIPFEGKTKSIVWPVSNCAPPSRRQTYAQKLSQYIDLDIYGTCGKYKCPRSQTEQCMDKFQKEYKFYFSFENSVCTDYVTEKFFSPLKYELVPIVYGGADYHEHAPEHSYINMRDFSSPKQLAEYLKYLSNNRTEYESYFQWKQNYTVARAGMWSTFCGICDKLQDGHYHKDVWGIASWWSSSNACNNELMNKYLS